MECHGIVKLRLGKASSDCNGSGLEDLRSVWTDHVEADNFIRVAVAYEFV